MRRAFVLNKEISAQKILDTIGEMLSKTSNLNDRVLVLEIRTIGYERIMLPLLEYKGDAQE